MIILWKLAFYYHGIRVGHGELIHFNDLCLFMWPTGIDVSQSYTDTYAYAYK